MREHFSALGAGVTGGWVGGGDGFRFPTAPPAPPSPNPHPPAPLTPLPLPIQHPQERQRHDMVAEHYRRQDADAVAMTALNRELESRLAEAASRAAELTSALRAAELRERQSAARLKTLESRADLARLLADLKVDDLRALAETQSGVTRAITERLLPALSMALPALASEALPDTEPPTPVAVSAAPSRATATAVAPAATAVPASA